MKLQDSVDRHVTFYIQYLFFLKKHIYSNMQYYVQFEEYILHRRAKRPQFNGA